jgi:hypothetical protein
MALKCISEKRGMKVRTDWIQNRTGPNGGRAPANIPNIHPTNKQLN